MMATMPNETDLADAALVDLARRGDRRAFSALVERHYDFIHRVAYRWCGRKADAEDVAQEVCARLGASIRGFKNAGAFTTWLYATTLNAARDLGRRSARESAKLSAFGVASLIDGEAGPAPDTRADDLWTAVRQLPDKQRDSVLLVYAEDLSHAMAAEVLGISESTVSWHIHEAKKRLKVLMRQAGEG